MRIVKLLGEEFITCPYCKSVLAYTREDITDNYNFCEITIGKKKEITNRPFIVCFVCKNKIFIRNSFDN